MGGSRSEKRVTLEVPPWQKWVVVMAAAILACPVRLFPHDLPDVEGEQRLKSPFLSKRIR